MTTEIRGEINHDGEQFVRQRRDRFLAHQLFAWQEKVRSLQESALDTWDEMGKAEPGTIQHKVHIAGQRVAEDMSPEERLTKSIPKNVSKVGLLTSCGT